MTKCISALVAGLALVALPAVAVQPTRSVASAPATIHLPTGNILYDQTDNVGTTSITSQNFETANDAFDNAAADDFEVPAGFTWTVTDLNIPGVYFNGVGPVVSVDVNFYADSTGLPGASECAAAGVVPVSDTLGTFAINLPTACVLPAGAHWVSVIANMDLAVGGQWGWTERAVQSFTGSVWQNPANGFGSDCTTWANRVGCGIGTDPDLLFALFGTANNTVSIVEVPTLGVWGFAALALLLATGGLWLLARRRTA